jgi:hypothetical protein
VSGLEPSEQPWIKLLNSQIIDKDKYRLAPSPSPLPKDVFIGGENVALRQLGAKTFSRQGFFPE